MQELPDPTTKIVWDNVALMSPATAERLGVEVEYEEGRFDVSVLELSIGDRSLPIPVWIQPGMPLGSITVTLGYGREIESPRPERVGRLFDLDTYTDIWARGPIANGVGVNVAPLRTAAFERVFVGGGAEVYAQFLETADRMELTLVDGSYEADTFFPAYEHLVGPVYEVADVDERDGFRFVTYVRKVDA